MGSKHKVKHSHAKYQQTYKSCNVIAVLAKHGGELGGAKETNKFHHSKSHEESNHKVFEFEISQKVVSVMVVPDVEVQFHDMLSLGNRSKLEQISQEQKENT